MSSTPPTDASPPSSVARALAWLQSRAAPSTREEALALFVHALLLAHGFRPRGTAADASADALPREWGAAGYGGRYAHSRSSLTFDIRATRVGRRLVVNAVALEDDGEMHTLPLVVDDFVAEDGPWEDRLLRRDDVATVVQVQIAHRLVPDAAKEGYEQAAQGAGGGGAQTARAGSASARPAPYAPRLEDPLRVGGPRLPGAWVPPAVGGGEYGRDDLLAPGLPQVGRGRGLGIGGGMGGNLMGPGNFPGRLGVGRGIRPQGVPPGARFDPYLPFGPDNDMERPPGWEDEHGLGGGTGGGGMGGPPMGGPFGGGGRPFGGGF